MTKARSNATAPAAKGEIVVGTGSDVSGILAAGSANQVLTVDSATATGLKWAAAPTSQDNWVLLNPGGTALTGAGTITVSGISGRNKIAMFVDDASATENGPYFAFRINGDTGNNYWNFYNQVIPLTTYDVSMWNHFGGALDRFSFARLSVGASTGTVAGGIIIQGCNTSGAKIVQWNGSGSNAGGSQAYAALVGSGWYDSSSTISSVSVVVGNGNFDAGTLYVYATS